MSGLIHAYTSYINSQVKYLKQEVRRQKRASEPFVTISRETGAFGLSIAENLADYLRENERRTKCVWTVFDKELITKVAQEHNLPETVLPFFSESTISEIQEILEETLSPHPSRYVVVRKIRETILHLAQLGYVIIIGRAANIITSQLAGGVHVRLVSPLEKRIHHMQEYLNLTEKQSREYVIKEDRNRKNYVKKYFDQDINNPLLYSLVINTEKIPAPEAAQMIGELVLKHHH